MPPLKLTQLMVFVPDLEQARAFYGGVLGFPVTAEGEGHLVFGHEGAALVAFRCERAGAVGDYAREGRAVFVFGVPSVDEAMHALRARGVAFLHDVPAEGPLGRYAAFVDPFGIVHEVQEQAAG